MALVAAMLGPAMDNGLARTPPMGCEPLALSSFKVDLMGAPGGGVGCSKMLVSLPSRLVLCCIDMIGSTWNGYNNPTNPATINAAAVTIDKLGLRELAPPRKAIGQSIDMLQGLHQ